MGSTMAALSPVALITNTPGSAHSRRSSTPRANKPLHRSIFGHVMLGPMEARDECIDLLDPQGRLHLHNDDLLPVVRNDVSNS